MLQLAAPDEQLSAMDRERMLRSYVAKGALWRFHGAWRDEVTHALESLPDDTHGGDARSGGGAGSPVSLPPDAHGGGTRSMEEEYGEVEQRNERDLAVLARLMRGDGAGFTAAQRFVLLMHQALGFSHAFIQQMLTRHPGLHRKLGFKSQPAQTRKVLSDAYQRAARNAARKEEP